MASSYVTKNLPLTFGLFTAKENWNFYFERSDNPSEWYADWPLLQASLTNHLQFPSWKKPPPPKDVVILVPACGNSKLSEHLYDDGFTNINNVDFSDIVIASMSERNVEKRPFMEWSVMDITNMKFESGKFDAIIDKGGLDALDEPKSCTRLRTRYLSEVKRLLKAQGKYILFTLPESHVLGLLFSKFRFGWKISLYAIAEEPSSGTTKLQTIMVVAEKDNPTVVSHISSYMDNYLMECQELSRSLEREKLIRTEYSKSIVWRSLKDTQQSLRESILVLNARRIIKIVLGEGGDRFFYTAVLLDNAKDSGSFVNDIRVLFFKKTRASERILSSEIRQRLAAKYSKAARLLIIVLDSTYPFIRSKIALKDIDRFISKLSQQVCGDEVNVLVTPASDGIKYRKIVREVTSDVTGPIVVDEVIYFPGREEIALNPQHHHYEFKLRRLSFLRTESSLQSEAFLLTQGPNKISSEVEGKKGQAALKISYDEASSGETKVDHTILAGFFHNAIIAGLLLFSVHAELHSPAGGLVKIVVIGLGAGLLPMFMRTCLFDLQPSLQIEVVEMDPVVLAVAKEYFDLRVDNHLRSHRENFEEMLQPSMQFDHREDGLESLCCTVFSVGGTGMFSVHIVDAMDFLGDRATNTAAGKDSFKIDVLIVDVDSSDSSSGLVRPDAEFVEESFFWTVKESLSENGILVLNLVSRFPVVREAIYSRLKKVFRNLFHLWIEENFDLVIFALNNDSLIDIDKLSETCVSLANALNGRYVFRKVMTDLKLIESLPNEEAEIPFGSVRVFVSSLYI